MAWATPWLGITRGDVSTRPALQMAAAEKVNIPVCNRPSGTAGAFFDRPG
ncbi:hypothetical protein [Hymenobacter sp. YC55]|nr:hypothetical protein [Hymenobacter sp. YC55]MDF7813806.1 hypothetical protein [Hymenobacter sp. YC55]